MDAETEPMKAQCGGCGYTVTHALRDGLCNDCASAPLLDALSELRRALIDEGPRPQFHRQIKNRHRREWPALWRALDKLSAPRAVSPDAQGDEWMATHWSCLIHGVREKLCCDDAIPFTPATAAPDRSPRAAEKLADSEPYQCPGCSRWFTVTVPQMSCCVLHPPGSCCHHFEQEVPPPRAAEPCVCFDCHQRITGSVYVRRGPDGVTMVTVHKNNHCTLPFAAPRAAEGEASAPTCVTCDGTGQYRFEVVGASWIKPCPECSAIRSTFTPAINSPPTDSSLIAALPDAGERDTEDATNAIAFRDVVAALTDEQRSALGRPLATIARALAAVSPRDHAEGGRCDSGSSHASEAE